MPDETNVNEIINRVIELFRWYLKACKLGPNFSDSELTTFLGSLGKEMGDLSIRSRKVFICYGKEDIDKATEIYNKLVNRGHQPWMDKQSLLPGQDWEFEIARSIKASDFFIVCLSNSSVTKRGYVQKEVKFALDVLGEIPPGQIFLIPVRLEACEVPPTLRFLHWLDINDEDDYKKLFGAIENEKNR